MRPPPSNLDGLKSVENGQVLIEKLKSLSTQISDMISDFDSGQSTRSKDEGSKSSASVNRSSVDETDDDLPSQDDIAGHSSDDSKDSDGNYDIVKS